MAQTARLVVLGHKTAGQMAREFMTLVLDRGQRQEAEQDDLRAAIAGTALPDEADWQKLAMDRSMR